MQVQSFLLACLGDVNALDFCIIAMDFLTFSVDFFAFSSRDLIIFFSFFASEEDSH